MIVGAVATAGGWFEALGTGNETLRFLASGGAVLLTFLAGAELEHETLKKKLTEVSIVGTIGFFAPFIGCSLVARFILGWDTQASLLSGIALSTTSMAVVYAVMLETGFNRTEFGKGILGSCFINDIGTVLGLSLIFSPFTYKTYCLHSRVPARVFPTDDRKKRVKNWKRKGRGEIAYSVILEYPQLEGRFF